jgi:hypothetical protein
MNYFNDPKYFGTEIVFRSFCKPHFLFADSHVVPDTKLGRRDSTTLPLGLHPAPYCEDVSVGHSRRRHACSCLNCDIVSTDKFLQNVNIAVRILERKISEKSISDSPVSTFHDRTFNIGIFAKLILNALLTQHVLKMFI